MKRVFILALLSLILIRCGDGDEPTVTNKNLWTKLTDFPGGPRSRMYSFSIAGKGYAGGGLFLDDQINGTQYKDLWEYSPETDQWIKKNDLPFAVWGEQSFTINDKVYLLTFGIALLEYTPSTDTWVSKASFPAYRSGHRGFVLNGKIYVGCGYNNSNTNEIFNDWWEYDPATNVWTQKADAPFGVRFYAASWSSSGKGYYGFGLNNLSLPHNDFWEYDQVTDKWTAKGTAGLISPTGDASSFTINDKPFLGFPVSDTGMFFEYNVSTNSWKTKAPFKSKFNKELALFSIGETTYLVGGFFNGFSNQVWKYDY